MVFKCRFQGTVWKIRKIILNMNRLFSCKRKWKRKYWLILSFTCCCIFFFHLPQWKCPEQKFPLKLNACTRFNFNNIVVYLFDTTWNSCEQLICTSWLPAYFVVNLWLTCFFTSVCIILIYLHAWAKIEVQLWQLFNKNILKRSNGLILRQYRFNRTATRKVPYCLLKRVNSKVIFLTLKTIQEVVSKIWPQSWNELSELPRRRENREFKSPFFQTGKTQGICSKILKICFYTGNLPPTQAKFWIKKKRTCNLSGWNYPLVVLTRILVSELLFCKLLRRLLK